jgi:Cu/Ag efflux protein CusF
VLSPYRGTGTVTKVAHELGAVMIDHDPMTVLGWPATNMTFAIRDQALLDNIGSTNHPCDEP